jgi:hypothetical protein
MFPCPKDTVEGTGMVFNVKRTVMGELFIAMIRKAINRSQYKLRIRGSHSDRKGFFERTGIRLGDDAVDLRHADRLRVYIEGIPQSSEIEYWKGEAKHYQAEYNRLSLKLSGIRRTLESR